MEREEGEERERETWELRKNLTVLAKSRTTAV